MTNQEILSVFRPFVDFLGSALGENVEVVLHDFSDPEHSIIAIAHGHHSGRKIGDPMTDFAVEVKNEKLYMTADFKANYRAVSKEKEYLSSSYYIKNNGELIGMLCLNSNTHSANQFAEAVKRLFQDMNFGFIISGEKERDKIEESLDVPIVSLAKSIIETTIMNYDIAPERMSRDEKMQIVWELDDQGVTQMKGAVFEIAKQLKISESTIYRYISKRKK